MDKDSNSLPALLVLISSGQTQSESETSTNEQVCDLPQEAVEDNPTSSTSLPLQSKISDSSSLEKRKDKKLEKKEKKKMKKEQKKAAKIEKCLQKQKAKETAKKKKGNKCDELKKGECSVHDNASTENRVTTVRPYQDDEEGQDLEQPFPVAQDDFVDIECIELTDEQPTHTSMMEQQPQGFEQVFGNIPTLEEKLKLDNKKRKREKKEAKKEAKQNKRHQIRMEKYLAKTDKQKEFDAINKKKKAAKQESEKKRREKKMAELNEYFEFQEDIIQGRYNPCKKLSNRELSHYNYMRRCFYTRATYIRELSEIHEKLELAKEKVSKFEEQVSKMEESKKDWKLSKMKMMDIIRNRRDLWVAKNSVNHWRRYTIFYKLGIAHKEKDIERHSHHYARMFRPTIDDKGTLPKGIYFGKNVPFVDHRYLPNVEGLLPRLTPVFLEQLNNS